MLSELILALFLVTCGAVLATGSRSGSPGWSLPVRGMAAGGRPPRASASLGDLTAAMCASVLSRVQITRYTNETVIGSSDRYAHVHPRDYPLVMQHRDVIERDVQTGVNEGLAERGAAPVDLAVVDVVSDTGIELGAPVLLSPAESKSRVAALAEERARARERRHAEEQAVAGDLQAQLVRIHGDGPPVIPLVQGENPIGRHPDNGDGQVLVETVSRRQARIEVRADGTALLEDLGAHNGTTIDGQRVEPHAAELLRPGTAIGFGRHVEYRYEAVDPALGSTGDDE